MIVVFSSFYKMTLVTKTIQSPFLRRIFLALAEAAQRPLRQRFYWMLGRTPAAVTQPEGEGGKRVWKDPAQTS